MKDTILDGLLDEILEDVDGARGPRVPQDPADGAARMRRVAVIDDSALRDAGVNEEEVRLLLAFSKSPEWEALRKVLSYFHLQSKSVLFNPNTPLDTLRHMQGRLAQLNEIGNFITQDLQEVYDATTRPKGGR